MEKEIKKQIMFSMTSSIQASQFAFYQLNDSEFENFKNIKDKVYLDNYDPVLVEEQGYVGTIQNYQNPIEFHKNIELSKKSAKQPNPGLQDIATLKNNKNFLLTVGTIKMINNYEKPSLFDSQEQYELLRTFISKYKKEFGLKYLIEKYIKNIINGNFLWRNQYGLNKFLILEVKTKQLNIQEKFDIDKDDEKNIEKKLNDIVTQIEEAIVEKNGFSIINVYYMIDIGFGATVFPSQEFKDDKSESKGKYLAYSEISKDQKQAILHSQKVSNAIRTIDTWYNKNEKNNDAIPVEVYGVISSQRRILRPSGENSFFDIFETKKFKKFIENFENQHEYDKHYMMSMFLKGGVFGV